MSTDTTTVEASVPASAEQAEVWLAVQREPESSRYNIPLDLEFTPGVDVPALRAALADVLAAHPALRSAFRTEAGRLVRTVQVAPPVPFVVDAAPGPDDPAQAAAWSAAAARAPFDLAVAP